MEMVKTRRYKAGYEIRTIKCPDIESGGPPYTQVKLAYTPDGHYIGSSRWAHRLIVKRGIKPELASTEDNVCSIGFCEKEQTWYGWSHMDICGFGISSEVKKGNCAYRHAGVDDFIDWVVEFYSGECREATALLKSVDGISGISVELTHSDKVPNEALRGQISSIFCPFPETWGCGEWTAVTLEDARQMAVDFAEGVS